MRLSYSSLVLLPLLLQTGLAWTNAEKAVYNRWHRTELERWLDDNNVPHPTSADVKELRGLVKKNWDSVTSPSWFQSWDDVRLNDYIKSKTGVASTGKDRNALVKQIEVIWNEGVSKLPTEKWDEAKDWVFDSWSDSQLRSFLEYHKITKPALTTREKLLNAVKESYDDVARKFEGQPSASDVVHYPGNWLYDSWSDSDLRNWLVERGLLEPKAVPKTRAGLVAAVRRNWFVSQVMGGVNSLHDSASSASVSASKSASSASQVVSSSLNSASKEASASLKSADAKASSEAARISSKAESVLKERLSQASKASSEAAKSISSLEALAIDNWSDSQLNKWAKQQKIAIPTGIDRKELNALINKHKSKLASDASSASAAASATLGGAYGAATTSAGNSFAHATNTASNIIWGARDKIKGALGLKVEKSEAEKIEDAIRAKLAAAKDEL